MVFLATDLRPPTGVGLDAIVRLAAERGVAGIHVGGGCELAMVGPLLKAAGRVGLEPFSMALPQPERPLAPGRRLPRLVAPDRDERAAAIELTEQGLVAGLAAGCRQFLLDFGPVHLAERRSDLVRAFARREMGEDETGGQVLASALAERRARGAEVGDACGFALERLIRTGERLGAAYLLRLGATPWEVPSPREAGELLAAFTGAPVRVAWDPGILSALCSLGLPISDDRLRALAASAGVVVENDAVGLATGYLPGTGERDERISGIALPAGVPKILLGPKSATDEEVAAAVSRLG